MMWPYRLFVPDRDDPTKLHAYFSGCQGRHSDIHSTLPGERFAAMKDEWVSNGAWGYSNIKSVRECAENTIYLLRFFVFFPFLGGDLRAAAILW